MYCRNFFFKDAIVPLTDEMKKEIVDYLLQFSKGLIEDDGPTSIAYEQEAITRDDIHDFIDEIRDDLIEKIEFPEPS